MGVDNKLFTVDFEFDLIEFFIANTLLVRIEFFIWRLDRCILVEMLKFLEMFIP